MTVEQYRELLRYKTVANKKLTRVLVKASRIQDTNKKLEAMDAAKPILDALNYINSMIHAYKEQSA